jgi:hypothetical protein
MAMKITKDLLQPSLPVILCHAACSGGSLTYRLLVAAFDLVGISEVSHASIPGIKTYMPLDPEAQLYSQGIISPAPFAEIFSRRLNHCEKIAATMGKNLLVREHSHRYFFYPHHEEFTIDSVSWINDRYKKDKQQDLLCLVSVRDPIDSWLGLCRNFPREHPFTFDEYCGKYLEFLEHTENTKCFRIIKYEDIVERTEETLSKIGQVIGLDLEPNYTQNYTNVDSSGNSGRQSRGIVARERRPFSMNLIRASRSSANYQVLCRKLGYPLLTETIGSKERYRLVKTYANHYLNSVFTAIGRPINNAAEKFYRISD